MRKVLMAFAAAAVCLGVPVFAFAQDTVVAGTAEIPSGAPLIEMGTADLSSCHLVAQADYLHWWVRGNNIPPIVTTGSTGDARPGVIGQPGTSVQFGGDRLNYNDLNGGRFGLLLEGNQLSYDVSYFNMSPRTSRYGASSDSTGNPVIAVPFNSTAPAGTPGIPTGEAVFAIADANIPANGSISVSSRLEVWGAETNAYWNWRRNDSGRTDLLLGFRYVEVKNNFLINATTTNPLATETINDTFQTQNQFYGVNIGAKTHRQLYGNLSADVSAKVALGVMDEQIDIHGIRTAPGFDPQLSGFFANSGNSGTTTHDVFAAVPELQVRLSYDLTTWFRVYGGYDLFYMSSVAMAGDQLNRNINPTFIPNPAFGPPVGLNSPIRSDKKTDFLANGVTFGFELSF
jgi:Putative beta barrel porin-7 (BBP7)